MKLVVANLNYSSWSVRPWFFLTEKNVPFEEELIDFSRDGYQAEIARRSPSARVPCLALDDGDFVWDSLAIAETLAEILPPGTVWPEATSLRRMARSACAEMHAGFGEVRRVFTCNARRTYERRLVDRLVEQERARAAIDGEVARLHGLWSALLDASGGPFLGGSTFGMVDAFFVPVVSRFRTYAVESPAAAARYRATIETLPAWSRWMDRARAEPQVVARYEYDHLA